MVEIFSQFCWVRIFFLRSSTAQAPVSLPYPRRQILLIYPFIYTFPARFYFKPEKIIFAKSIALPFSNNATPSNMSCPRNSRIGFLCVVLMSLLPFKAIPISPDSRPTYFQILVISWLEHTTNPSRPGIKQLKEGKSVSKPSRYLKRAAKFDKTRRMEVVILVEGWSD